MSDTSSAAMSAALTAGGRMGAAIAAHNWTATTAGPLSGWPVSLRAVVQMMLAQRQAMCLFWGPDLILIYNDAYAPMLGAREPRSLGRPFKEVWADVWNDVQPFVQQALAGQGTWSENMRLIMTRNGYEEETFWTFSYSPVFDDSGQIAGIIDVAVDTTAAVVSQRELEASYEDAQRNIVMLAEANRQHRVLQRELLHRVKNNLAVTTSVVKQSIRHARTLEEARESITRRITALGRAQDLLTDAGVEEDIAAIVTDALQPHLDRPNRVSLSGPAIEIPSQQGMGLSLAVHELATNALKYGAFLNDTGRVEISWSRQGEDGIRFEWQESGGPLVASPSRKGFGSRLTDQIVAAYFSGTGETRYEPGGLYFVLNGRIEKPVSERPDAE